MQVISFLRLTKNLLKQFGKKYQPSNTQIVRNFDQDIPLSFYSAMYTRIVKPASRLLVLIRWSKDTIKLSKLHAYQITNQLCARSDSMNQIRISTQEHDELALLKHIITQGRPSTIKEVPSVFNHIGHLEKK